LVGAIVDMYRDGFDLNSLGLDFSKFCLCVIRCLILKADSKENDKASAIRSKHSVTEQRRRSKINERYVDIK